MVVFVVFNVSATYPLIGLSVKITRHITLFPAPKAVFVVGTRLIHNVFDVSFTPVVNKELDAGLAVEAKNLLKLYRYVPVAAS